MKKPNKALGVTAVVALALVGGSVAIALPAQAQELVKTTVSGIEDGTNDGETADDTGIEDGTNDGETADDTEIEDGTNDGETADDATDTDNVQEEDGTNDGETAD